MITRVISCSLSIIAFMDLYLWKNPDMADVSQGGNAYVGASAKIDPMRSAKLTGPSLSPRTSIIPKDQLISPCCPAM